MGGCGRFGTSFLLWIYAPYNPAASHFLPSQLQRHSIMAIPSVQQLDRPEPLHKVLAEDKPEDCLPCRVTGERNSVGSRKVSLTPVSRGGGIHRPWYIQLFLWPFSIKGTTGQDYTKQEPSWNKNAPSRHYHYCALSRRDGTMETR